MTFRPDRSPVEKPGPGSRTCRPWMGGKRQAGCRFLLVTSLLDTQKRSNSPSAGGRKLLALKPVAPNEARASRTGCAPTARRERARRRATINASRTAPARARRSPAIRQARENDSRSAGGRKLVALKPVAPDGARASRTGCAPTARRKCGWRRATINASREAPTRARHSPASAAAHRGGCRSRCRSIPTSPSMPADSRARSLRGSEDKAPPRRRRRPSG